MSDANYEQLRPPPTWEAFEEICADFFSRLWNDPHVVRYGRRGQAQDGVDVYGKDHGDDAGVQCKAKREWPPTKLTTAEIDAEVEEAKKFRPHLKTYIVVTTAENDVHLTDRVNAISAEHAKQGLFRVTVYGWSDLARRLGNYPELLDRHFDIYVLRQFRDDANALPDAVADHVAEKLQNASLNANTAEQAPSKQRGLLDDKLADALERDFNSRYQVALQRSMFL